MEESNYMVRTNETILPQEIVFCNRWMTDKKPKSGTLVHLSAGALSGLISCMLLQPLDLRLQQNIQQRRSLLAKLSEFQLRNMGNLTTLGTVRDVIKQDGVLGLWRGTLPTIIRNVPGMGLYFMCLNELRVRLGLLSNGTSAATNAINLLSGASARVFVGFVMMPVTVIKIRYESNLYTDRTILSSIKSIATKDGPAGFFRGFGATALRDAPSAGLYVLFYENFRFLFRSIGVLDAASVNMSSGLFAGLCSTLATQPFDTVKTRMQLKPSEYRRLLSSFVRIAREEGWNGFFSGTLPRLLRKSIGSAISWTIYEELSQRMKSK
eukprot:jgi/Hompol1/4899/HPOL_004009-RA